MDLPTDSSQYIHGTDPEEQERLTLLNGLLNAASLRAMRLQPGDRVLDLGSGLGQLTRAMARQASPGGVVVGVERDPEQLTAAEDRAAAAGEAELVDFRPGTITQMPLEEEEWGSFDVVHCRFLLEHVRQPERAVRALYRAARPGGRLILEDDDHDLLRLHPPVPLVDRLWRAYVETYSYLGNDPYVGRRLPQLLRDAGAEPTKTDMLFFGTTAGRSTFGAMMANFRGLLWGARELIPIASGLTEDEMDAAFDAFDAWCRRDDATLWYTTCWAEGVKPGAGAEVPARPPSERSEPGAGPHAAASRAAESSEASDSAAISALADQRPALWRFLTDSAADLSSTLRLEEVFQKIAQRIQLLLDAHLVCIMLWNEDEQLLEHSYSLKYGRRVELKGGFPLGYGLSGAVARDRRPIRLADVRTDPRYVRVRHAEVEIRSELVLPLRFDGRLIGVLDLESTEPAAFTAEHEETLTALASHIASALENARLYEAVRANERRLESDLASARAVQNALSPTELPRVAGLEIGAARAPALELSGDFFDLLPYGDERLALVLGDVAGKGTGAALLGSVAVGMLRAQALRRLERPRVLLSRLNRRLLDLQLEHRFVALVLGVVDGAARLLRLSNAGIPAPLRLRGERVEALALPGLPLGSLSDPEYGELEIDVEPGDVIAFFSDGLEEAGGAAESERFGTDGIENVLRDHRGRGAQEIAEALLAAADRHTAGGELPDDRTVLVLKAL